MTDGFGTVVWAADYKPFGEATITVSTITNNLRFPGQYFDQETGLYYNSRRDYNSAIGRYIEADPLNLGSIQILRAQAEKKPSKSSKKKKSSQSILQAFLRHHLFTYVENNPLRLIDPHGLAGVTEVELF